MTKKKINRTCILLAVNVNINPHQLCNPAVISLKLKQIINFVNRAEDWWCHPCRQFICKEFDISYANQHWNNTRREQKIKEPLNLHANTCKWAPQARSSLLPPSSPHRQRAGPGHGWDWRRAEHRAGVFPLLGQTAKTGELPETAPLRWYIGQLCLYCKAYLYKMSWKAASAGRNKHRLKEAVSLYSCCCSISVAKQLLFCHVRACRGGWFSLISSSRWLRPPAVPRCVCAWGNASGSAI